MISAIIFTKNRPLQLNALLESMHKNCDIFDWIYVQWTGDIKPDFDLGEKYNLEYRYENFRDMGFHRTLIDIIDHIQTPYIAFFVDDDICHRPVYFGELKEALKECDIFSLRLGKNITKKVHFEYKGS